MNQNPPIVSEKQSVETAAVPFSEIPGQSALFLDYQIDSPLADKYYPEKHRPLRDFAATVLAAYTVDRDTLCDELFAANKEYGAKIKTFINIELLRRKDCVAVVASGPAGLFGGPLETVYKALSVIKLARDLRARNIRAVPVFWIDEENHDFAGVGKTLVIDREGDLVKIENTPENYIQNFPVGFVRFDETITETIERLFSELRPTAFSAEIKSRLVRTYRPGETWSSAFARFLTSLFADHGLIIFSPLNEEFKRLASPLLTKAVERSDEIVAGLLRTGNTLRSENYHPQMLIEDSSFPFFLQNQKGERRALRRDAATGKTRVHNSNTEFERAELVRIARTKPQYLSANALLQPVVRDFLLPTVACFGDAAEIASFAQSAVIYELLNRPVTPVRHHTSLTIIEGKHARLLESYQLQFRDLLAGQEKVLGHIIENFLTDDTDGIFAEVGDIFNNQLDRLEEHLQQTEPALAFDLDKRRRKILRHLTTLRKKHHRAELLKDEAACRRLETLYISLFPDEGLQERSINAVTFLNLYGPDLIEWLQTAVENDGKRHRLLYLLNEPSE